METYFRENTDIQEWVDLLIEKLFTVCLLSGSDADSEFFRGKQAAEKISSILQSLTALPEDALLGGIRQLVEQRLPDPRVIDNFPQFYSLMEDMIQSGIPKVDASVSYAQIPSSRSSSEIASSKIKLSQGPEITENFTQVYIPEVQVSNNGESVVTSVFAPITALSKENLASEIEIFTEKLEPVIVKSEVNFENEVPPKDCSVAEVILPEPEITETPTAMEHEYDQGHSGEHESDQEQKQELELNQGQERKFEPVFEHESEPVPDFEIKHENIIEIPVEGEQLSRVLKLLYPEKQPLWNIKINQFTIFAQIDNLVFLIFKEDSTEAEEAQKELEKQGLAVTICQQEDLAYPRRLERYIRETLRKSVSPKTSTSFLS
jgi:hypothetical protein